MALNCDKVLEYLTNNENKNKKTFGIISDDLSQQIMTYYWNNSQSLDLLKRKIQLKNDLLVLLRN
jgi:hypothetical protein